MNKCNICQIVHEESEPMTNQEKEELIKMCKRITNHDRGVATQTPDEKVLDYLERAKKILKKYSEYTPAYDVIEVAKLLQREERSI